MNPITLLLVTVAGGFGAAARFLLDDLIRRRVRVAYPVGTTVINASGSLVLGFVVGVAASVAFVAPWATVIGTGFLGGYTTFSSASVETVRLARDRRRVAALANAFGMLILCVGLAAAGRWLGSAL